ncbi:MAG: hypothetical protein U1E53_12975 [Dongiaceae bacterium]
MSTSTKKRLPALLAAAAIAALGACIAVPASATLVENGIKYNGFSSNGFTANGVKPNGVKNNGASPTGQQDGFDFGAIAVLGVE